jgi:hypothetical protein
VHAERGVGAAFEMSFYLFEIPEAGHFVNVLMPARMAGHFRECFCFFCTRSALSMEKMR